MNYAQLCDALRTCGLCGDSEPIRMMESAQKKGKIKRVNDKGESVPETCPNCGSKVGLFLRGEPVWVCTNKKCDKYFGTAPCNRD